MPELRDRGTTAGAGGYSPAGFRPAAFDQAVILTDRRSRSVLAPVERILRDLIPVTEAILFRPGAMVGRVLAPFQVAA